MEEAKVEAFEKTYEVTRRLFSGSDLKSTLSAIVAVTVDLIGADYASVVLFDDEGQVLEEFENLSNLKPLSKRMRSDGITQRIISTMKPVFVPDVLEHKDTNPALKESGIRSYVGMPLVSNGRAQAVLYVYSTKSNAFDRHHKMLTVMARFAELALRNADLVQEMKTLAIRDGLTGLYNYRYLYERLDKEAERVRESGSPLSVVFMDLDNFKFINDTYGHLCGDVALKHFARTCQRLVCSTDVVARTGGDEIVMILPSTTGEEARCAVRRIRDALAASPICLSESGEPQQPMTLMMSAGVASYPEDSKDVRELVKIADQRLLEEKRIRRGSIHSRRFCNRSERHRTAHSM